MKPETVFRVTKVKPFLETLKHTFSFPIQQLSIVGTPDFLICCNGFFVALELKSLGGKLSKLQEYNLNEVKRTGGISIVATPTNWDEVQRFLTNLTKEKKEWNWQSPK